ncbi:MotA/TolQ/ExbB proton channel family protein [Kamptonema cortianum]|nr:MotA/TolQ/ExbB proton channel family protein [Oscillatoria laete-virens]MDK3159631.1 MotA/TolQ/ExbB proton channel family protein [Kamptonema cortianum]MDL5050280.1 MotA/TolQ/ExbB proton channel family protein [Oscillatoria amoena NRMC-F 0135]MDL5055114.1 MotA/TolQ/ExbB proton channel family protein [Oscillatoria laete-virens NRMC-F 0139]
MKFDIKTKLIAVFVLSMTLWLASMTYVGAQDTGETEAGATEEVQKQTLMFYLKQGGMTVIMLGMISVFMLTIIMDGFYNMREVRMAPEPLFARLKQSINAGNYQEAWEISKANPCFMTNIFRLGLERIGKGEDSMELAIEEATKTEAAKLNSKISYLSVIGVVSPMIGLTGTVFGMMGAFGSMANAGPSATRELAAHIGHVLVATAAGLLVSIPGFVFYYVFRNMVAQQVLIATLKINRLRDDIPFKEIHGIKIGEVFAPPPAGGAAASGASVSRVVTPPPGAAQSVACPACGTAVTVGQPSCHACGTVLQWS